MPAIRSVYPFFVVSVLRRLARYDHSRLTTCGSLYLGTGPVSRMTYCYTLMTSPPATGTKLCRGNDQPRASTSLPASGLASKGAGLRDGVW